MTTVSLSLHGGEKLHQGRHAGWYLQARSPSVCYISIIGMVRTIWPGPALRTWDLCGSLTGRFPGTLPACCTHVNTGTVRILDV